MDDLISRKWLVECIEEEWIRLDTEKDYNKMIHLVRDTAPSVQIEKEVPIRVRWSGWKGHRYTRYYCPNCEKPVRNDDCYCHRCGQKLMFPKITFTPYVPGEKQQTIVTWEDDLISRQAAVEVTDAIWTVTGDKNVAKVWQQLKDLPSAQPERKKGRWLTDGGRQE